MYTPDRVIVRKLREYDPHLFVSWNNKSGYFEVWRHMPHGRRLITPVTQSIYEHKAPKGFVDLDERILWWLAEADSWRYGGHKKFAHTADKRWQEFQKQSDVKRFRDNRDWAKDVYSGANAFYTTKHSARNTKATAVTKKTPERQFIRPDLQSKTSPRLFTRSAQNALRYNFKK